MNRFTLFLLFLINSLTTYAQVGEGCKLIVTLENAPFDSLFLLDYTGDRRAFIEGRKTDLFTWQIDIPDSIALDGEYMRLLVSRYDVSTNSAVEVSFINQKASKDQVIGNVGLEDSVNYIHAYYKGQRVFKDEWISLKIDNKDSLINGVLIMEDFVLVKEKSGLDIRVRAEEPFFAWFMSSDESEKSYSEYLASYEKLTKKYPDSKYLVMYLANNLANFKSIEDVRLLFNNLSDKHQHTLWYSRIERFLNNKFQNIPLLNAVTGMQENIILDSTKYNLVIFTASYCGPCIEEIPLLQEMYIDLKDKVEFTYVSIDKESDIQKFEKLLTTHNIPWRSLYAAGKTKLMEDLYYLKGIPYTIFVDTNGRMQLLDVRVKDQRDKIYKELY